VSDAQLKFVKNKTEWNGTKVVFEIAKKGDKTELRFTRVGLVRPSNATVTVQARGAFISTTVCGI
jgi:hypothetical protein